MNLFSEDRHAPARAEARLCGPRTGRAGKVERTGVDQTSRRERRATSRGTCATLGPVPHLGNFHPQYPKRRWAASNAAGLSLLTASDEPLGPPSFRSSVQKASAPASPERASARGEPFTAGPLRLVSGAGPGGRAGCPNTATPEHIPSAILSYGAKRGFGKAACAGVPGKIPYVPDPCVRVVGSPDAHNVPR